MKPKDTPSRTRRATSMESEASKRLKTEVERPLDAEDVALSRLDAKVRAVEARADLGSTEPYAGLTVRLPRAVISQVLAEATTRRITPSELVRRALVQYRPMRNTGQRPSSRRASR